MVERSPVLDGVCHAILIAGAVIVCAPLYFAFVAGSLSIADVQRVPLPWLPGSQLLTNLQTAWVKGNFAHTFVNSSVIALCIMAGKIAVSLLSAFAVTYFRFPFRMTAFWLIFVSLMLPIEVRISPTYQAVANAALPLQWLADTLGIASWWQALTGQAISIHLEWNMIDTYPGLVLPLIASASATFLFRQFFLTVPDELCEAARIDGASPMTFFWTILLPLSKGNIAALAVILFLYGWNQYLWPLLFTTDKDMMTAVVALKNLVPRSDTEPAWNIAMSGALLTMLPPVVVVVLLQRSMVRGLVDSGK
jgi:sn-glycerol 3-phosphate transport system permease protein